MEARRHGHPALLGEAFILLPEFTLRRPGSPNGRTCGPTGPDLLTHLTTGPDATPFPVDDWLHGVARVRERMRHLELTVLLGEALGAADPPALEALQFPYRAGRLVAGPALPGDVARRDAVRADRGQAAVLGDVRRRARRSTRPVPTPTYSGLLLDEWVEVIPTDEATTGLAFHFDRPNSEAPQAILLATPPQFRGAWQWQDIVDTLHETLDFARLRAVEPAQIWTQSPLAPLLPAVLSSVTTYPITAPLNLGFNNNLHLLLAEEARQ